MIDRMVSICLLTCSTYKNQKATVAFKTQTLNSWEINDTTGLYSAPEVTDIANSLAVHALLQKSQGIKSGESGSQWNGPM